VRRYILIQYTSKQAFSCYYINMFMSSWLIPNTPDILCRGEVYKEYLQSRSESFFGVVSKPYFVKLWKKHFGHVKIREYKAVTGKCMVCAQLSNDRKSFKDNARRQRITDFHALHRQTYMGERKAYYDRQQKALDNPTDYMSIICDGMQQTHTQLPWLANQKQFSATLKHSLQGILEHGHEAFTVYRCYHNVKKNGNFVIHTILRQLERRQQRTGNV
jgi:hypothetical protein